MPCVAAPVGRDSCHWLRAPAMRRSRKPSRCRLPNRHARAAGRGQIRTACTTPHACRAGGLLRGRSWLEQLERHLLQTAFGADDQSSVRGELRHVTEQGRAKRLGFTRGVSSASSGGHQGSRLRENRGPAGESTHPGVRAREDDAERCGLGESDLEEDLVGPQDGLHITKTDGARAQFAATV